MADIPLIANFINHSHTAFTILKHAEIKLSTLCYWAFPRQTVNLSQIEVLIVNPRAWLRPRPNCMIQI